VRDQRLTGGGQALGAAGATQAAEGAGPAESGPAESGPVVAPSWVGRLYNAAGGALPPEHREWVRRDLTGPGWRRRMVLRPVLLAAPFAVLFMAVPGSLQLRIPIAIGILLWTAGMSLAMSGSFRDRRLRINGLSPVDDPISDEDAWDEQLRAAEERRRGGAPAPDALDTHVT
jgi:hypothetical protein